MHHFSLADGERNLPEPPPVPWTPRDVAWGIGAFILWLLLFVLLSLVGDMLTIPGDPGLYVVFGEMLLLIPAWYFTVYKYGASLKDLGLRGFAGSAIGLGCGLMLLSVFFNILYSAVLGLFGLRMQPDIAPLFEQTDSPLVLFLGGAVIAPFVEEVFFRGFVFAGLRGRWSWQRAAVVSSALFAVAHVVPTSVLPIFILGIVFALLYQVSGSIWPAILMHMLTNSIALALAYALSQGWIPTPAGLP